MPIDHKFINLFTDFGFKRIFGTIDHKDLLIDFLNSLLADEIPTIVDITYLPTEKLGKKVQDCKAVFDLFCQNEKGEKFIIELQKAEQLFFKDRSIYYATFPMQEQAQKGKNWNYELGLIYTIALMNFVFDTQYPTKVISRIALGDRETNELFDDKLRFVYVEMPKCNRKLSECHTNLERWLYVFKNMHLLEKIPIEFRENASKKLFTACEIANYTKEELMEYEQSWKEHNDLQNVIHTAEVKGEQKGLEKGLQQGLQQGVEKGTYNKAKEVALNAVKEGFDNSIIQKLTGLSLNEIEKLRKEIK